MSGGWQSCMCIVISTLLLSCNWLNYYNSPSVTKLSGLPYGAAMNPESLHILSVNGTLKPIRWSEEPINVTKNFLLSKEQYKQIKNPCDMSTHLIA